MSNLINAIKKLIGFETMPQLPAAPTTMASPAVVKLEPKVNPVEKIKILDQLNPEKIRSRIQELKEITMPAFTPQEIQDLKMTIPRPGRMQRDIGKLLWQRAFDFYNKHHPARPMLSMMCIPCYVKVLNYIIKTHNYGT